MKIMKGTLYTNHYKEDASSEPRISSNSMKQLKSHARDLRDLFEQRITVKHVAEFKLVTCYPNDDANVVRKQMEACDFDVLPMKEKGVIYGYVRQSDLKNGLCEQYENIFHPSELVAESMPLTDLLPLLRDVSRVFVLDRNRVSGIVTRGDLQKAPVRMLFFGYVTLLEMNLLRLIRSYYPKESWKKYLSDKRLKKAQKLFKERKDRNEAIDLADCLEFCDKRVLILKKPQIRKSLGLKSKRFGEFLLKEVQELRDKLAHAQDIVGNSSWTEVIDLIERVEELLRRCEEIKIES
jgi:predicted transcriptional regulator